MKRVLIITYYWPPSGGSGVQRWVKFAKFLPQYGWQPVIYTPANPEYGVLDESLCADIPDGAEIIRTPIIEPYALYRRVMGKGSSVNITELTSSDSPGRPVSFKNKLSLFIRGNFFVPDPRVWWVRPSVRFLKRYLKEHPVDAIISTGPPHSVHLTARKVALATGIPWLLDFRDPWTGIYYFDKLGLTRLSRRRYFSMERNCLRDATVVLTCTPSVQKDYRSKTSTPVEMITNGYDPDDYRVEPEPDGHFNICQTGQLGADGNPGVLWRVLSEICAEDAEFRKELRIRLLGTVDNAVLESIKESGLTDNLVYLGYQPHLVAVREQVSASLLLIPLRNSPEMAKILPGKIFEYLAAHRPVLGFGQEDGAMAKVIRDTGCGHMCAWDNAELAREAVLEAWDIYRKGSIPSNYEEYSKYERKKLTGDLAGILDRMI